MPSEVNEHGIPARGSALHIAYYVNVAPAELDATLGEQLLIEQPIQWVSPLASDRFVEYHDRAFLEAVGQGGLGAALEAWWPRGGAHWDALGVAADGAVVLVEAKANIAEMTSGAGSGGQYWLTEGAGEPRADRSGAARDSAGDGSP